MDDRGRDGGTYFVLRIKEQETRLTLQERDDYDEEMICESLKTVYRGVICSEGKKVFLINTVIWFVFL